MVKISEARDVKSMVIVDGSRTAAEPLVGIVYLQRMLIRSQHLSQHLLSVHQRLRSSWLLPLALHMHHPVQPTVIQTLDDCHRQCGWWLKAGYWRRAFAHTWTHGVRGDGPRSTRAVFEVCRAHAWEQGGAMGRFMQSDTA